MALFAVAILNGLILIIKTGKMLGEDHFFSKITNNSIFTVFANFAIVIFFVSSIGYYMLSGRDFISPILSIFILSFLVLLLLVSLMKENKNN